MKIKQFGVLSIVAAALVTLLYFQTNQSPYVQWTTNVAYIMFAICFFAVTTVYVFWRVAWTFFRRNRTAVTCVLLMLLTVGVYATCWDDYQGKAIQAYNDLDSCIRGTNSDPWYTRVSVRAVCNAKYISDAEEAAFGYAGCMGFGGFAELVK